MLNSFFTPKSVAVVGASSIETKVGYAVLKNIIDHGFDGQIFPINPKGGEILGCQVYTGFDALPEPADLAVFVIPSVHVVKVVEEFGGSQFKNAIIISAGFKETGHDGAELEKRLKDICAERGVRVVGPNCLGLIDTWSKLNASFAVGMPHRGNIAFFSQSGALGTAILDWSIQNNIGLSKFISIGNKMDLSEIEFMEALAEDPNTKVILGYIEGVNDGARFIEAAKKVTSIKPVIFFKSGSTKAGAKAASSHTGTLVGSESAYKAAFKQARVLRATTIEELFDYALAFSYQNVPEGNRVAVLTNAGGPGIMAADCIETSKLSMASLADETKTELVKVLPAAAALSNPVDVIGDAAADRYHNAIEILEKDPNVDGVYVIMTPQAMTEPEESARSICAKAAESKKPFLCSFIGGNMLKEGVRILNEGQVPNYFSPSRGVAALEAMHIYNQNRKNTDDTVVTHDRDKGRVSAVFAAAREKGMTGLTEYLAREVIEAYGFTVPQGGVAVTCDEACELAQRIGFPVVLKIASDDISHKSDVGGVKVNIKNRDDLTAAYVTMMETISKRMPEARLDGVMVNKMHLGGIEVILGMTRDSQFGPLVMFGAGGIYVEVLKDVAFRVCPVSRADARSMIEEIKMYPLLTGVRGQKSVDIDELVCAIERISTLVCDFPEIEELDINPLKIYPKGEGGAVAIDGRIILG